MSQCNNMESFSYQLKVLSWDSYRRRLSMHPFLGSHRHTGLERLELKGNLTHECVFFLHTLASIFFLFSAVSHVFNFRLWAPQSTDLSSYCFYLKCHAIDGARQMITNMHHLGHSHEETLCRSCLPDVQAQDWKLEWAYMQESPMNIGHRV